MRLITNTIPLDVTKPTIQAIVTVNQGDTARELVFPLMQGQDQYIPDDDAHAELSIPRRPGVEIVGACSLSDGVARYTFSEQTTALTGKWIMQLVIFDAEGNVLYAPQLLMIVIQSQYRVSRVIASSEFTALSMLIAEFTAKKEQLESLWLEMSEDIGSLQDRTDALELILQNLDLSSYQKKLTFDSHLTPGSQNPVTSGGAYEDVQAAIMQVMGAVVCRFTPEVRAAFSSWLSEAFDAAKKGYYKVAPNKAQYEAAYTSLRALLDASEPTERVYTVTLVGDGTATVNVDRVIGGQMFQIVVTAAAGLQFDAALCRVTMNGYPLTFVDPGNGPLYVGSMTGATGDIVITYVTKPLNRDPILELIVDGETINVYELPYAGQKLMLAGSYDGASGSLNVSASSDDWRLVSCLIAGVPGTSAMLNEPVITVRAVTVRRYTASVELTHALAYLDTSEQDEFAPARYDAGALFDVFIKPETGYELLWDAIPESSDIRVTGLDELQVDNMSSGWRVRGTVTGNVVVTAAAGEIHVLSGYTFTEGSTMIEKSISLIPVGFTIHDLIEEGDITVFRIETGSVSGDVRYRAVSSGLVMEPAAVASGVSDYEIEADGFSLSLSLTTTVATQISFASSMPVMLNGGVAPFGVWTNPSLRPAYFGRKYRSDVAAGITGDYVLQSVYYRIDSGNAQQASVDGTVFTIPASDMTGAITITGVSLRSRSANEAAQNSDGVLVIEGLIAAQNNDGVLVIDMAD